jgi:hypothetical protein
MGKILKGLVATLTIGSALAASAPAQARHYHGWGGWNRGHGWHGDHRWHRGWGDGWRGGWHHRGWRGYYGPRYGWGYYGRPRYYYHHHDHDDALIAGIAALAIGAAIASSD